LPPVGSRPWLPALLPARAPGGLIGALTDHGVDKDQADIYAEGIRRGGTLVSVRTSDARELEVERIMAAHTFVDPIARGESYRAQDGVGLIPTRHMYRRSPRSPLGCRVSSFS